VDQWSGFQGMIRRTKTYDVDDAFVANELYQDNGWTDGLPIIPPTEKLVRAFLDSAQTDTNLTDGGLR